MSSIVYQTCFSSCQLVEFIWSFCCLSTFLDSRKRRRRNSGLVMAKKRRKLLPFNPSEDYIRRLEQMATLATALTATETLFVNELTYVPGMAPRSANCSSLEREGMQVYSTSKILSMLFQVKLLVITDVMLQILLKWRLDIAFCKKTLISNLYVDRALSRNWMAEKIPC